MCPEVNSLQAPSQSQLVQPRQSRGPPSTCPSFFLTSNRSPHAAAAFTMAPLYLSTAVLGVLKHR